MMHPAIEAQRASVERMRKLARQIGFPTVVADLMQSELLQMERNLDVLEHVPFARPPVQRLPWPARIAGFWARPAAPIASAPGNA